VIQRVGRSSSSSRKVEYCSRMVWRARMGIEGVGVCVLLYWAIGGLGVVEWQERGGPLAPKFGGTGVVFGVGFAWFNV
jgi:hypothetical protein